MSILSALAPLAHVAGAGFSGYEQSQRQQVLDALAQAKSAREERAEKLAEMLGARTLRTPVLGDAAYTKGQGDVAGAEANARVPAAVEQARQLVPIDVSKAVSTAQALRPIEVGKAVDIAANTAPITQRTHEKERLFDVDHEPPSKPTILATPNGVVRVPEKGPAEPVVDAAGAPIQKTGPGGQANPQMAAAKANIEAARHTLDAFEEKLRAGNASYGPIDATKGAVGSSEQTQTSKGLLGPVEGLIGNVAGASLRGDNPDLAEYLKAKKFLAEAILNTHKRPNQTQYEIEQELAGIGPRMGDWTSPEAASQIAQSKERRDRMFNEVFAGNATTPAGTPTVKASAGGVLKRFGIP